MDRIVERINVNLREFGFDAAPFVRETVPLNQRLKFHAFCGITSEHPVSFNFKHSNLAGSYFLGKCQVDHTLIYKSDIRGDELKSKGDRFHFKDVELPVYHDEIIRVKDACLFKTLVHCYSHDPESLEEFIIQNTVSMHYANIHGSPVEGCFLGPFSTVDLTTVHDTIIGTFAYVYVGELFHQRVKPGRIWIKADDLFEFDYTFSKKVLDQYISITPGEKPTGILIDFLRSCKTDFQNIFEVVNLKAPIAVPRGASLNRYAVVKGQSHISENVLVAQRAYLKNAWMGKGANAQENCYIINSRLEGNDVMAHGAKIIHTHLGKNVFVGFNSFLRGTREFPLTIGSKSIIMPHTIIDLNESLKIPSGHLVWGYIRNAKDLQKHTISIQKLSKVKRKVSVGDMKFQGIGSDFIHAFQHRIKHILEANGAFFDGKKHKGHAQKSQDISFNMMHPYRKGRLKGIYPMIDIQP